MIVAAHLQVRTLRSTFGSPVQQAFFSTTARPSASSASPVRYMNNDGLCI